MTEAVSFVISSMLLVLGLSYLIQPGEWTRLAKDAMEGPSRYFPLMLFILVLGLTVVASHNLWVSDWAVVVTIMGWLMTIKAILYLCVPQFVKPFASWSESAMRTYVRVGGIAMVMLAAPLVYRHLLAS